MSVPFSLGDVGILRVAPDGFEGWDYPSFAVTHRRLDDGAGTGTGSEIVQSASPPARRAMVRGNFINRSDKETIQGYNLSKEQVVFTDDNNDSVVCVVLDMAVSQPWPGYWTFEMILIEQL